MEANQVVVSENQRNMMDKQNEFKQSLALEPVTTIGEGTAVLEMNADNGIMKKYISPFTMIAVCFNICNSWAGVSGSMQIALLQGGPATLIYGMLLTTVLYLSIALTIAELSSVYPTAGGQYHFASILGPKSFTRAISYICGIITAFSWISIGAAIMIIPSTQIIALTSYYHPTYIPHKWHYFLIYQAMGLTVLFYNLWALKKLPRTHDVGFFLAITLFLATFVTLLARSSPKASHEFVWNTFINQTGWNHGVCFFSGLLTTCFMYAGLDAALHLAEEAPDPRRSVPRASILAVCIGFVTAFLFTIALLYSISDFEAILAIQGYLSFEINRQAMRSDTAALAFLIISPFLSFFILNAVFQTSSRLTWAFSRDNAIFLSRHFEQIHPTLEIPVNATILNWAIVASCGCIFLVSTTAFNAVVSSSVVLQQLSFVIPAALLIYRRRSEEYLPKSRAFALPNWLGWMANIIVVVLATLFTVFFLFPPFLPVTGDNMNYTVVVLFIAALLGLLNWIFHGRKYYQGPQIIFHD